MKKFLALAVFGWLLGIGLLQAETIPGEYRKVLVRYMQYRIEGHAFDNLQSTYAQVTQQYLLGEGNTTKPGLTQEQAAQLADQMASRYMKEQLPDAMADIMWPHIQGIPLDELQTLVDLMGKPEVRNAEAKLQQGTLALMPQFTQWGIQLASGQALEPVKEKPCSASYKKLFDQYYAQSGMDDMMEQAFAAIAKAIPDAPEGFTSKASEIIKLLRPAMLNITIDNLSEEELALYMKTTELPAYPKLLTILPKVMADPTAFAQQIIGKYAEWADTQLAE